MTGACTTSVHGVTGHSCSARDADFLHHRSVPCALRQLIRCHAQQAVCRQVPTKFRVFDEMVQAFSSSLQTLVCCVIKACIYVVQNIHDDLCTPGVLGCVLMPNLASPSVNESNLQ